MTKHVVAVSGGKDSVAMALALMEREPRDDYEFVITPTGNETPEMFNHWIKVGKLLGKPLKPIIENTLVGLIREQQMIPNHTARFCTRILKLEPYYRWLATQTPCVSYVGLRADEESRPGMLFPDANGVTMRFPMQEWGWGLDDVLGFLAERNITIPERTDCMLCFWQRLGEWYELWEENPQAYAEGEQLEWEISEFRGRDFTFRSPQRDAWPASLRELRLRFEAGEIPTRSLKMLDARRKVGSCRICTL